MDALEVGVLRLVTGLHQHLKAAAHQVHHAAAQHGLLAEQVGLGLVVEGGLHHPRPRAADARDVGQGDLVGVAGGVLLHRHQAGHALARHVGGADGVARALGGGHEHVHPGGGDDLLVADVEAVGEGQGLALGHVGGDVPVVDLGLHLVVDEDHHDIRPLSGGGDGFHRQPGGLGGGPALGALPQAHAHIAAGVLQVQGVGVALGAVADDGDLFALQPAQVAVLLVVHFSHGKNTPHKKCYENASLFLPSRRAGGEERFARVMVLRVYHGGGEKNDNRDTIRGYSSPNRTRPGPCCRNCCGWWPPPAPGPPCRCAPAPGCRTRPAAFPGRRPWTPGR